MSNVFMRYLLGVHIRCSVWTKVIKAIKMTRAFDNASQENAEQDHQGITECQEEYVFLVESEQETYEHAQNRHLYVGESKTFDSSDSSVDSGYETKDPNQCQLILINVAPQEKQKLGRSLDVNQDAEKISFFLHGAEIENKCENRQRVRKPKCVHICLSLSFVGNIVLLLVVVLLAINAVNIVEIGGEMCDVSKRVLQDSLCIPCNNLGSQVMAEDTLFDFISSGGFKFCCLKNAAIQTFFLLMVHEGYTSEATTNRRTALNNAEVNRTLNTWRSREIAAHLYANTASLPEKLTWTTDVGFGSAFLSGITLTQESRLMVPRAGYYFIYSAVTFKCQHNSKTHIHLINRQHRGRPIAGVQQLLLRKSSECGPNGFYTSFLSGVLKLTSNDEISVNLTEDSISSVYVSSLSSFFGGYVL